MSDLVEEFQKRVDQYFQTGQKEPGGRIILDMMRAIRNLQKQLDLSAQAWKTWESTLRVRDAEIAELRAELRRIKFQWRGP